MTFGSVLTLLFFLVFLAALAGWLFLYVRFGNSVEKRWATAVLHLWHDAETSARLENQKCRELHKEREAKARSLHEEAFAAHLCDYSVDELEAYPGIGPSTVGKLRNAGFANLATLHRARIRIHGLGQKRLADINYAVRNLLGKARSAFDGGNIRQAQALADQLKSLSAQHDRLEAKAQMRARAAEEFIDSLAEIVEHARAVTFWRWLRPISHEVPIPLDIMDGPLAVLEAALREAEQRTTVKPAISPRPVAACVAAAAPSVVSQSSDAEPTAAPPPPLATLVSLSVPVIPSPQQASPTNDQCLSLLEISAASPLSADLVRRQWNLLSQRLAPEKVASMGAEFVKLAQDKIEMLRRAAESLLDEMGEKLETGQPTPPVQDLRHNPDLDDVFGGT